MQVIGLCRFSYPALGGFQVTHETTEERIAYIWAEDRLEERFRLFECVTLPGLRAHTDQDFTLIVLIGDSFPKHHRDRLRDLTADLRQIKIVAQPPQNNREIAKALLNGARRNPDSPCIQFRLDDDDAVAVDFVERLRDAARDCRKLTQQNISITFDWQKGYVAEFSAQGISASPMHRAFFTAGMGMWIAGGSTRTIHHFGHERIPRYMTCVTFSEPAMFIRSHNGFNDSRQKRARAIDVTPLTKDQARLFKRRFAIDAAQVRSVFGAG